MLPRIISDEAVTWENRTRSGRARIAHRIAVSRANLDAYLYRFAKLEIAKEGGITSQHPINHAIAVELSVLQLYSDINDALATVIKKRGGRGNPTYVTTTGLIIAG